MLYDAVPTPRHATAPAARPAAPAPRRHARRDLADAGAHSRAIGERLALISSSVEVQRHLMRADQKVYRSGDRFTHLFVVNSGFYKIVTLSPDGREQIVSFKFRGDWLGLDGIAEGAHDCDVVAMDIGEVWAIPYAALLQACATRPALMAVLHEGMSREITGDRNSLMTVCTLPADARVADFLSNWAGALARRGLRNDHIQLHMTRAEIGNYLGISLETVSRALSKLVREGLIGFPDKCRRDIVIDDVAALDGFVQQCLAPVLPLH
jgi:CRP/FNR family transcriptional regulator